MVSVRLSGVHRVKAGGRVYHYAWRGGPRLPGQPGDPEFVAAYTKAHATRKAPLKGTLHEIVAKYRASPDFTRLSDHTQRAYKPHLDTIQAKWGRMPREVLEDPEVRTAFLDWRDSMADRPRTADMAMGVLKRVLSWGVERVLLHHNHAAPIGRLHSVNKADHIWTADDIAALLKHASAEVGWAVQLALHTGLRQGDLIRLAWNHEKDGALNYLTSKRGKFVTIPITPACRALLDGIAKRGPVILTTARTKRPWTADGLRASFQAACKAAGVKRTFHDLRRTAATNLLSAGIEASQVAMIMGWAEDDVEAMKRKYVSRKAVVESVLKQLEKAK